MSFIKPFSHCCVFGCVCVCAHTPFSILLSLFLNVFLSTYQISVLPHLSPCVSVIAITARCLKAWLRIHICCFFFFFAGSVFFSSSSGFKGCFFFFKKILCFSHTGKFADTNEPFLDESRQIPMRCRFQFCSQAAGKEESVTGGRCLISGLSPANAEQVPWR